MIQTCQHKHEHRAITINDVLRTDPTRTKTIRDAFEREARKRIDWLVKVIVKAIGEYDVLGLGPKTQAMPTPDEAVAIIQRRMYPFATSAQKVDGFMDWLNEMENQSILEVIHRPGAIRGTTQAWSDVYVRSAYQKGIARAQAELGQLDLDDLGDTGKRTVAAAFNQIFHAERVGLLYTRVFEELKGVDAAMDQQISRVLSTGMSEGRGPRDMAEMLRQTITGEGGEGLGITDILGRYIPAKRRAEMIARTEIIRAHHQANINEYELAGVEGVEVIAEWSTAGYNVCPICAALQGKEFTLAQIRGMIPAHPNCLIDGQVKIYTSEGWKRIKDVVVGDLVLTHKKRFQKVTQLHRTPKQKPEAVTLRLTEDDSRQNTKLSLTADHPVLIGDQWIAAKDVKAGDEIHFLADKCQRCGESIPYFRKYCSQSCLSKDITEKQWADPAHREIVSQKNRDSTNRQYALGLRDKDKNTKSANEKCRELAKNGEHVFQRADVKEKARKKNNTPELRAASSRRMKKNNPMHNPIVKERVKKSLEDLYEKHPEKRINSRMGKFRRRDAMTWIERRMAKLLDKIGIEYISEYPILRYRVDFAIPSLRIAIECDGEQWHKNQGYEAERQRRIEVEGWFVLRYTGTRINQCLDEIESELARVFGNHNGDFDFIKMAVVKVTHWQLEKSRTLYNLSVEEDESYIANGFVVHNCRCAAIPKVKGFKGEKKERTEESFRQKEPLMGTAKQLSNCIAGKPITANVLFVVNRPQQCVDYYRTKDGKWQLQGKDVSDEIRERLNKLKVPPAWSNVVVSKDPTAKIQVIGLDAAQRWQYLYSAEHMAVAARKKFDRIKLFSRDIGTIRKGIDDGIANGDARAYLARLEDKTAIRAGSTADFKAKKKAYGLTTLRNDHVRIDGDKIILDFTAKEGLPAHYELNDKVLASWLKERKTVVGATDALFSDVSADKLNAYIKESAGGKKYTIKDFRTYHASVIAREELKQFAGQELSITDKKKVVKQVSEKVSSFLHNTPTMAKNSYIDPMVWEIIGGLP